MITRTHALAAASFGVAMLFAVALPLSASADSYTLTATPNPCTLSSAGGNCTSVISWAIPTGIINQLWVSAPGQPDALVACFGGPQTAAVTAPWITSAGDTFKLYVTTSCLTSEIAGKTPVATLNVAGVFATPIPIAYLITATPSAGAAPLSVTFTGSAPPTHMLDFGDGTPLITTACSDGCPDPVPLNESHVYATVGTYKALLKSSTGTVVGSTVVTVANAVPNPPPPPSPSPMTCVDLTYNMHLGSTDASTGGDVSRLQNFLISNAQLTGTTATGYYGPLTRYAVGQFQIAHGIVASKSDPAYGFTGPRTRAVLSCSAPPTPPPPTPGPPPPPLPPPPPPPSSTVMLNVTPTSAAQGAVVTVSWSGIPTPTSTDWIGLFPSSSTDYSTPLASAYTSCNLSATAVAGSGTCNLTLPASLSVGDYEYAIFASGSYTPLAISATIHVTTNTPPPPPPPPPSSAPTASLTANGSHEITIAAGSSVTYAWSSTNAASAQHSHTQDSPDTCPATTASMDPASVTTASGSYTRTSIPECRAGHTYTITYTVTGTSGTQASDSVIIHVTNPTTLSVSPTTAAVGSYVTVSFANIVNATGNEWIGMFKAGDPADGAHLVNYRYTSCTSLPRATGLASGSCPFPLAAAVVLPGNYYFELFQTIGYAIPAVMSGTLTVTQ